MMGTGQAAGEQRAVVASEEAIVNPLLDDASLKGAKSLLLSITGGRDLTLWEVDEAANRVRQEVDPDANIIVGATFDESLGDKVRVSIVASGMARTHVQPRPAAGEAWRPRGSSTAASAPGDYQMRLSEAIDGGNGRADANGGKVRRAAGEVYITEGPPQLGSPPEPMHDSDGAANGAPAGGAYANGVANGRHHPGIEDLPPHAQREYWAKSGEGEARPPFVYQRQPERPAQKPSLLRRLTGGGRNKRNEERGGQLQKHSRNRDDASITEEQVDLPVFFGRPKR
jgi:cell division protein FtsZ